MQNPGNKTLQENLVNAASDLALKTFGGDETVKKLLEVIKNPNNKTIQENLLDVATDLAVKKFGDDDTLKQVIEVFKNPDKKTRQAKILSLVADLALKTFGNDEMLKKVVNLFQNPENKTLQENVLDLAAEIALKAFNGDDTIKKVIEVFQNPGNKTLQENLLNLAAEVAFKKFGVDPSLKRVFEVIQNPGNKTFQDNLLDIAVDVALSKAGVDETLGKIAKTLLIPGNKTLHQNLVNLATELAAQKGSKVLGDVLGNFLGESTVDGAKQKVGAVGQALKVGGGIFGGFLSQIGGNSVLGKIGQAITGGTQTIGGVMTNIAGNDTKTGNAIGLIGSSLEKGNITIQDAFKQATALIANAGTTPEGMKMKDEAINQSNTILNAISESISNESKISDEEIKKETESTVKDFDKVVKDNTLGEETLKPTYEIYKTENLDHNTESVNVIQDDNALNLEKLPQSDEIKSIKVEENSQLNENSNTKYAGVVEKLLVDENKENKEVLITKEEPLPDSSQIPVIASENNLKAVSDSPFENNPLEQKSQQSPDKAQYSPLQDAGTENTNIFESQTDATNIQEPTTTYANKYNFQEPTDKNVGSTNRVNVEHIGVGNQTRQNNQVDFATSAGFGGGLMDLEITTVKIQIN